MPKDLVLEKEVRTVSEDPRTRGCSSFRGVNMPATLGADEVLGPNQASP